MCIRDRGKEGDPASPVGLRPTALRCSQQAGPSGAELAGSAGSNSSPGKPRLLLRCSAVQTGYLEAPSLFGSDSGNSTRRQLGFECMDNTSRFRRGSVAVQSPFHTAEQHSSRRRSPARLFEPAQPASSATAACCEQRRGVVGNADDRFGRVAFLAFFFGDAKKKVARRGETRPTTRH